MAEKKKDEKKLNKSSINNLVNFVQKNINKLYKTTYYTQPDNKIDLQSLKSDIDSSIDSIVNANVDSTGLPNISRLYSRINDINGITSKKTDKTVISSIEQLFDDKSLTDALLLSTFNDNKYLKSFDEEVDIICKYMPQLEDALDAKKDNVLSADHYSKDFINVINNSNINVEATFIERIKQIKEKYNLLEEFDKMYDNTAKYGEQFIYVVPYNKALTRLLQNKSTNTYNNFTAIGESVINEAFMESSSSIDFDLKERKIVYEDGKVDTIPPEMLDDKENYVGFKVKLNMTGLLETAIKDHKNAERITKNRSTDIVPDDLSFEGLDGQEAISTPSSDKEKDIKIDVPGCIMKMIPRENIIPVYIDGICFGYYYIEMDSNLYFNHNRNIDPMLNFTHKTTNLQNEIDQKQNVLMYLSNQLSKYMDSKFINSNQDLSREIYIILKGNELLDSKKVNEIKITFIPPEDMVHMYFNRDRKTNRGVSDLEKALLPAKLYTALYVANVVGYLTRGFDKRVYYVKQNVETNIAQTLLNTINQIRKSNFGARELTNLKSMLNMTGRYNDYVIPMSMSGDYPIQFELMPGQQIEVKTELMNILEQMAINSTDVPYEYIQARQTVDYAVRLTMSNGKFLRKAFRRQMIAKKFYSMIITRIYNTEYKENDTLEVILPPPAFLNIMNTNQMLQNTNDYVQYIVDSEAADEDDNFKMEFTKRLKRFNLSTYIDYNAVDKIKEQTGMYIQANKKPDDQQM